MTEEYPDPDPTPWYQTREGLTLAAVVSWVTFLVIGSGVVYANLPSTLNTALAVVGVACLITSLVTSGKASIMEINRMVGENQE